MYVESRDIVRTAAQAAWDKKAMDLEIIDISGVSDIADYFFIATGQNNRHVDSIIDGVRENVREKEQQRPLSVEGMESLDWALIDYGSVIVHIFQPEPRDYYRLGSLWGDAPRMELDFLDAEDESGEKDEPAL